MDGRNCTNNVLDFNQCIKQPISESFQVLIFIGTLYNQLKIQKVQTQTGDLEKQREFGI